MNNSTPDDFDDILHPRTRRQDQFIAEYLIDLNATQAAIRAGYSPKNAQGISASLMALPHIQAAIERAQAQRLSRVKISQDDVIHEVSALALSRLDHYIVDDDGNVQLAEGAPDNAMAAIESIDRRKTIRESKDGTITVEHHVKLKLHDKPGQLKLLGRHVGLFPNKVEVTGKDGGPIDVVNRVESVIIDPKETD